MSGEGGALCQWLAESVHRLELTKVDSVTQWLVDVRCLTDSECQCVLQGKSLTADTAETVVSPPKLISERVDSIQNCMSVAQNSITKLRRRVNSEQWKRVQKSFHCVSSNVDAAVQACYSSQTLSPSDAFQQLQETAVMHYKDLSDYVNRYVEVNGHRPDWRHMTVMLNVLSQSLESLSCHCLSALLQTLFDSIRITTTHDIISVILSQIISVGVMHGDHVCRSAAAVGGVRKLTEMLSRHESCWRPPAVVAAAAARCQMSAEIDAQLLRTLATLCCVEECLIQLQESGGIECLCDILCDGGRSTSDVDVIQQSDQDGSGACRVRSQSERVRSEAAGVIAQITSPSLVLSARVDEMRRASLRSNMPDLVPALTDLCRDASSHEVFLLSCVALANMTLLESTTCHHLSLNSTVSVLVNASYQHIAHSVFAKDQIVTVLACMALVDSCRHWLSTEPGVAELLVQYLHEKTRGGATTIEKSACERLQQKSAVAIGRLSHSRDVGLIFVELHCVPRLVELCTDPVQRNHSNNVLIACLETLRQLHVVCGQSHLSLLADDVQSLVHYSAVSSLLQRSSTDESFI